MINRKALKWFLDSNHAWLRVDLKDLIKLKIVHEVSNYSYINGKYAYLEEDCDALYFAGAANLSLQDYNGETIPMVNCKNQSTIRKYRSFCADTFCLYYNNNLNEERGV